MAYSSTLASVPQERIAAFRRDTAVSLQASKVVCVSHLIAYWVQVHPLGQVLGEVIDGGQMLHPDVRHPLRSPAVHSAGSVPALHQKLRSAYDAASAEEEGPKDDWYEPQIRQVLGILAWAGERGEAVVMRLGWPYNEALEAQGALPRLA